MAYKVYEIDGDPALHRETFVDALQYEAEYAEKYEGGPYFNAELTEYTAECIDEYECLTVPKDMVHLVPFKRARDVYAPYGSAGFYGCPSIMRYGELGYEWTVEGEVDGYVIFVRMDGDHINGTIKHELAHIQAWHEEGLTHENRGLHHELLVELDAPR